MSETSAPFVPTPPHGGRDGSMPPTVAVAGAGLAGLVAALEAATAGCRVELFEARRTPGGRARTRVDDGFSFNDGAHALYRDGAAWAMLERHDAVPPGAAPEGHGVGIDGDVVGALPSSPLRALRTPLLAGARRRALTLLARIERLDSSAYDDVTVADAIDRLIGAGRPARTVAALLRLATYGHDPEVASAGPQLAQLAMAVSSGVHYVDGGWQTMIDALVARVDAAGVRRHVADKVEAVMDHGDRVEFRAGGEPHSADAVVVAVGGPAATVSALARPDPRVQRWADRARPCRVASLAVGLRGRWGDHPRFALGLDDPWYLSVHTPSARLAPAGGELLHLMRYHHPDATTDADDDRRVMEAAADRIRPGWRSLAVAERFSAGSVVAHDLPRAETGGLAGRPSHEVPGVSGVPGVSRVMVAGDWVGPTGLLADASVASATTAAAAAVRAARAGVR